MNYNSITYELFLKLLSSQSLNKFGCFSDTNNCILFSLIYHLIIQDRIYECLIFLKQLNNYDNTENINIDCLKCYLLLFDDENDENKCITQKNIFPTKKVKLCTDLHELFDDRKSINKENRFVPSNQHT